MSCAGVRFVCRWLGGPAYCDQGGRDGYCGGADTERFGRRRLLDLRAALRRADVNDTEEQSDEQVKCKEGTEARVAMHTCDPVLLLRESVMCVVEVSCASREAAEGKTNIPRSQHVLNIYSQ